MSVEEGFAEQPWCCTLVELLGFSVEVAAVVHDYFVPALSGVGVVPLVSYCAVPG